MVDCDKCLFVSVCKKRPTMPGAKIAECNTFRLKKESTKPQTNADCIRAMTDAELARFLAERNVNESTVLLLNEDHSLTDTEIEAMKHRIYCACMQWLKQPVEDKL